MSPIIKTHLQIEGGGTLNKLIFICLYMTKRFLSGALIDMDSAIIFRGAKVKAV